MSVFKESRTAKNILISFSAETQARTRYDFFAHRAEEEGYIQIAGIFRETARQEYEHAHRFFKFFNGGELEICWTFPAGVTRDTYANLISAAELENYVHETMYRQFAEIAGQEGYERAADTFDAISVAEKQHEKLYRELAANIENERVFRRPTVSVWRCLSCGYIHQGESAPDKCPACVKPTGYFELLGENW
ncbi:MAG: rubrerythrin family protein [Desulfopila sp.]|jgi:rubrerythrin|nr:rubrerythrin family protein [Desulfopila sp.]